MKDAIVQALQDIRKQFDVSIYSNASKFKGALLDVLPGASNEPIRILMNSAIGGMDVCTRLRNPASGNVAIEVTNLTKEMSKKYFITEDVAQTVIECIAMELFGHGTAPPASDDANPYDHRDIKFIIDRLSRLEEKVKWQELVISLMTQMLPKVGNIVPFGGYDWRVLNIRGGTALLLCEKVIFESTYHHNGGNITWERSSIREYLNNEFYNRTFSPYEKTKIALSRIANQRNPWFDTDGGHDTFDRVFLLSIEEVVRHLHGNIAALSSRPPAAWHISSPSNVQRIAYNENDVATWWLLRSSGKSSDHVANVYENGQINIGGRMSKDKIGVRPAIWLIFDEFSHNYYVNYGYYPAYWRKGESIFIGDLRINP